MVRNFLLSPLGTVCIKVRRPFKTSTYRSVIALFQPAFFTFLLGHSEGTEDQGSAHPDGLAVSRRPFAQVLK